MEKYILLTKVSKAKNKQDQTHKKKEDSKKFKNKVKKK